MVKIRVCDVCKSQGKLTEAKYYRSLKGVRDSAIDLCEPHKNSTPKNTIDFLVFSYKLSGLEITKKQAAEMLKRK